MKDNSISIFAQFPPNFSFLAELRPLRALSTEFFILCGIATETVIFQPTNARTNNCIKFCQPKHLFVNTMEAEQQVSCSEHQPFWRNTHHSTTAASSAAVSPSATKEEDDWCPSNACWKKTCPPGRSFAEFATFDVFHHHFKAVMEFTHWPTWTMVGDCAPELAQVP